MKPLPLKRLSAEEKRLFNAIFAINGNLGFEFGEKPFRLLFSLSADLCQPQIWLKLRTGKFEFSVGLESRFFAEQIPSFPEGESLERLPKEIRIAFIEAVAEELLDTFDKKQGSRTEILELTFRPPEEEHPHILSFSLKEERNLRSYLGRLSLTGESLAWMSDWIGKIPALSVFPWEKIPVFAGIEIGSTTLILADYNDLEVQDIVLMDASAFGPNGRAYLRFSPSYLWQASLEKNKISVLYTGEPTMAETKPPASDKSSPEGSEKPAPAPNIDEISVRLSFELGEKTISIGELKTIAPGYAFELDRTPEKPVTIKANGKTIGMGELVQIDERIGVRIAELWEHADH